jgi:hypothetical protein
MIGALVKKTHGETRPTRPSSARPAVGSKRPRCAPTPIHWTKRAATALTEDGEGERPAPG